MTEDKTDTTSMSSILSYVLDGISLPFPLLHCDGCDCEDEDCSSYKSIIIWVYMMMCNLLSHLADSYAIWLVPLLVIVWRYRWLAIHYIRALYYSRGVIPIITLDMLRNQDGEFEFERAVRILDIAICRPNVRLLMLLIDGILLDLEDLSSCHELAVYLKNISRAKGIQVVSFLRNKVTTEGYILALAADTIMVDFTTRLRMDVSQGVQDLLGEWGRTVIEVKEGVLDLVGVEVVTAGLASGIGN